MAEAPERGCAEIADMSCAQKIGTVQTAGGPFMRRRRSGLCRPTSRFPRFQGQEHPNKPSRSGDEECSEVPSGWG